MSISIVIPCFNEAAGLGRLRHELMPVALDLTRRDSVEIVLIDDGSSDETWQGLTDTFGDVCEGVPIRRRRHDINRGLGAAIRTGFAASTGTIVVTTDSDGTYRLNEIPLLLLRLDAETDIVTASPFHPKGAVDNVPQYRLVLSKGSSFIYRMLVTRRIHTYTALFRAYRRPVIDHISFDSDGFLAGTELLVKALLSGYRAGEYPTTLHARTVGTSKAKLIRTIRAHLGFQWRVLLHQLGVSSLVDRAQSEARVSPTLNRPR